MVSRKRAREEDEPAAVSEEPSTLHRLRNMWQFANLAQYLVLFIDALRMDKDFDIEDLEAECLNPQPSPKLAEIGLALLKHVSSHRGLTPEIFDEYARRQFVAKAPARNPFGKEEEPNKFDDFDIFTKIRVLQQLSIWTLNNPNSIREKLAPTEAEMVGWRIDPVGFDREGRTYMVLDDNRMYRLTDPPPPPSPPPKPKSKAKPKRSRGSRSSKRRKLASPPPEAEVEVEKEEEEEEEEEEEKANADEKAGAEPEDDGFGGRKWECVCITLEDYQSFLSSIRRSKDLDEKDLYESIEADVMPIMEQQAEERARKEARRAKEQEVLLKLATAKRSSRISSRLDKQKQQEEAVEAERKRLADIAMAQAEQEKQHKLEIDRDSRRMTREQRLREREAKRILEEEGLRKLKEDEERLSSNDAQARISERHLKAEMKRREEELMKLKEEDEWIFDCEICGVHGDSYDDGTQIIACDVCNVWQHTKCHGITPQQANRDDFHFICSYCKRKKEEANQPKLPPLKFRLTSASPNSQALANPNGTEPGAAPRTLSSVSIPAPGPSRPTTAQSAQPLFNGPSLSPRGQAHGPPGIQRSEAAYMNGSSSPIRAQFSPQKSASNVVLASSPPQYRTIQPAPAQLSNPAIAPRPLQPSFTSSFNSSFSRPTSSAGGPGPYSSPVKHSPAPSPKPTNGTTIPNAYDFTASPHSSFPPSYAPPPRPAYSPTKQASSPPPPLDYRSSPAPIPIPLSLSQASQAGQAQSPAQVLPDPIPAPEKHDAAKPIASHSFSQTSIFPPIAPLAPDERPVNLSPPVKKSSPHATPERKSVLPAAGLSFGDAAGAADEARLQ